MRIDYRPYCKRGTVKVRERPLPYPKIQREGIKHILIILYGLSSNIAYLLRPSEVKNTERRNLRDYHIVRIDVILLCIGCRNKVKRLCGNSRKGVDIIIYLSFVVLLIDVIEIDGKNHIRTESASQIRRHVIHHATIYDILSFNRPCRGKYDWNGHRTTHCAIK